MLKELFKIPYLAFFQPKELENRLNQKTRRKQLLIWAHLLMLPFLFCFNFLVLYLYFYKIEDGRLLTLDLPVLSVALYALLIAASYVFAIIASFFLSGLFKKDNLTIFIIGTYWSFFFNLLALNFFLAVNRADYYRRTAERYTLYDELIDLIFFLFFVVLIFLVCALVVNIYDRTKQFRIVVFIILAASLIANYLIASPNNSRITYLFLKHKELNRKYIYVIRAPQRKDYFDTFFPYTTVVYSDNLLFDIEKREKVSESEKPNVGGVLKNTVNQTNHVLSRTYTLDENITRTIEADLLKRAKEKKLGFVEPEIKAIVEKLKKIQFYSNNTDYDITDLLKEGRLKDFLFGLTNELHTLLELNDSSFIDSNYFINFIDKFSSDTTINISNEVYELDEQDANNFPLQTRSGYRNEGFSDIYFEEYEFKNLKISSDINSDGSKKEIKIQKISNSSAQKSSGANLTPVPGEKVFTIIPLTNDRIFIQTDAGYQFRNAVTGEVSGGFGEKWYRYSNYSLQGVNEYKPRFLSTVVDKPENSKVLENRYNGDVIHILSPSGYLLESQVPDEKNQVPDGETLKPLSETSIYADEISPLKSLSFYYICLYYITLGLLITYAGFYRLPIYLFECIAHIFSTSALSFGLISPSKSTRLTPLLWEHISTISFPFSKRYLNKLFSAEPQRCTDDLIYLLTKTNQKKFVADFSVDFFEQNQEFLFEFIYKSLKLDNGEAIKIVVENTKKNNSVTDLLRSYRQLLKVPSKQPYIPTHAMYLKNFAGEYYKYAKEVSMSYEAFSLFYKFNDLRELAESDKSLNEILKINYGEQLNTQIIEMFNIIVEFAQDVKNYDIVENFRDKQYYLSESRIKLYDLSAQAREVLHEPEKSIFLEIFEKWQGIITSEAKSLRGPADIAISILNKNLSVNDENEWQPIVVKIKNTGLSPAENIMLAFLDNENIEVGERTKEVRLLGIGEEAKLEFSIKSIGHSASLRINIDTSFDDFERKGKLRVFADILSVSSPSFEYKKVLNPYIVGTPLKNEKIFVGRSHALKFAEDNLSSGSQNNILIYFGQRRIGKSSILYQLMNSSLNDEYVFVYIDCQGFADADTARLLYRLCRDIRSSLSKEQILIEEPALDRFKENTFIELDDYLDKVELALNDDESPSRKKVVLMFDEYEFLEYMVKSEKVSSEIFNKLRNLMQHRNKSFAFIFVGTHRLTELTEDYWSFLFNIALYYEIGTLTEKEAKNLIVKPVEDYIKYDELAIDKIIRITGNHPYFIQVLCRLIVNYCNEHLKGYINLKDLNNVLEDAVEGSTAHVKYLFSDYSTKSEQEILTFLSRTTDDTKLFASPAEISRFAGENGFTYDIVTVQEILSGLKNKKLVREGGELGDLLGFEYEFLRLWIEKHVKIQNGFINIT